MRFVSASLLAASIIWPVSCSGQPERRPPGAHAVTFLVDTDMLDRGQVAPSMDLLIAATAVAHNAILVTHNTKHFEGIDGLQLEDWLA